MISEGTLQCFCGGWTCSLRICKSAHATDTTNFCNCAQEEGPESQGKDIEGVEYDQEEEAEDQETSQDRAMMDESTQDPVDPLIAYARMNAEREEAESEEEPQNPVIKRRLPAGGESQPARPRRRSYQLEPSQELESDPENPLETGAHGGNEGGGREDPIDLSQPEPDSPPLTEDQEDDDVMLEYFGDICCIQFKKVRGQGGKLVFSSIHHALFAPIFGSSP